MVKFVNSKFLTKTSPIFYNLPVTRIHTLVTTRAMSSTKRTLIY